MRLIAHHPPLEYLFDHATGSLAAAVSLAIASHLERCPACSADVADFESMAGALLTDVAPVAVSDGLLQAVLDRLEDRPAALRDHAAAPGHPFPAYLPEPLRRHIGGAWSSLEWRGFAGLFEEALLPSPSKDFRVSLLRAGKGGRVPMHDHLGPEHLLVLTGGLRSDAAQLTGGDYAIIEPGTSHEPVVDSDEQCVCLLVLDAPLRFAGAHARDLDPMFQI